MNASITGSNKVRVRPALSSLENPSPENC